MSATPLTVEVKECIKCDLNTWYQTEAIDLLLDTCVCLDLRFKDGFSMEDEPVVKLMDEIKAYGNQNEVLQAERPSQNSLQVLVQHHIQCQVQIRYCKCIWPI